jgi:hypothetical protein
LSPFCLDFGSRDFAKRRFERSEFALETTGRLKLVLQPTEHSRNPDRDKAGDCEAATNCFVIREHSADGGQDKQHAGHQ